MKFLQRGDDKYTNIHKEIIICNGKYTKVYRLYICKNAAELSDPSAIAASK